MPASPDAGWSSPVARQAHNLKAAGSNPAPATKFDEEKLSESPSTKPGEIRAIFLRFLRRIRNNRRIGVVADNVAQTNRSRPGQDWPPLYSPIAPITSRATSAPPASATASRISPSTVSARRAPRAWRASAASTSLSLPNWAAGCRSRRCGKTIAPIRAGSRRSSIRNLPSLRQGDLQTMRRPF